MNKWILLIISLIFSVATVVVLWLMYVIPFAPSVVISLSPFTSGVIKAKAFSQVDEESFYRRVSEWGTDRVESCYQLAKDQKDERVRTWSFVAIGHAGSIDDIPRLSNLIEGGSLSSEGKAAASDAMAILKVRHRY